MLYREPASVDRCINQGETHYLDGKQVKTGVCMLGCHVTVSVVTRLILNELNHTSTKVQSILELGRCSLVACMSL